MLALKIANILGVPFCFTGAPMPGTEEVLGLAEGFAEAAAIVVAP